MNENITKCDYMYKDQNIQEEKMLFAIGTLFQYLSNTMSEQFQCLNVVDSTGWAVIVSYPGYAMCLKHNNNKMNSITFCALIPSQAAKLSY